MLEPMTPWVSQLWSRTGRSLQHDLQHLTCLAHPCGAGTSVPTLAGREVKSGPPAATAVVCRLVVAVFALVLFPESGDPYVGWMTKHFSLMRLR